MPTVDRSPRRNNDDSHMPEMIFLAIAAAFAYFAVLTTGVWDSGPERPPCITGRPCLFDWKDDQKRLIMVDQP